MGIDAPTLTIRVPDEEKEKKGAVAGFNCEVLLDGKPVKGLRGLNLRIRYDDVVTATLELMPGSVEVDADVLAELEAEVERQKVEAL